MIADSHLTNRQSTARHIAPNRKPSEDLLDSTHRDDHKPWGYLIRQWFWYQINFSRLTARWERIPVALSVDYGGARFPDAKHCSPTCMQTWRSLCQPYRRETHGRIPKQPIERCCFNRLLNFIAFLQARALQCSLKREGRDKRWWLKASPWHVSRWLASGGDDLRRKF